MDQSLTAVVDAVLARTEPIVTRIKHEGQEADLRQLQEALAHLPAEIERRPDLHEAAQGLYDAASALVSVGGDASPHTPSAREARLRLFCEMHLRFYNQLMEIAPGTAGADQHF